MQLVIYSPIVLSIHDISGYFTVSQLCHIPFHLLRETSFYSYCKSKVQVQKLLDSKCIFKERNQKYIVETNSYHISNFCSLCNQNNVQETREAMKPEYGCMEGVYLGPRFGALGQGYNKAFSFGQCFTLSPSVEEWGEGKESQKGQQWAPSRICQQTGCTEKLGLMFLRSTLQMVSKC